MRIYVHIGLPKTATTTLQSDLFEAGHGDCWDYWGVLQPRSRHQREEYSALMRAVGGAQGSITVEATTDDLPIVISEEMIMVDDTRTHWQEKLLNMKNALGGHDVTILLTVRRPEVAAFSMFTELYHKYKREYTSFAEFLESCNQAKVYDYEHLIGYLDSLFGCDAVKVFAFEEISSGELASKMCSIINITNKQFHLGHANARRKNSRKVFTNPTTIGDTLGQWLWSDSRKYSVYGALRYALRLSCLSGVKLPWTAAELNVPNYSDYYDKYNKSNKWLYKRTGIDYIELAAQKDDEG